MIDLRGFDIQGEWISNYLQSFSLEFTRDILLQGNRMVDLESLVETLIHVNNSVTHLNLSETQFNTMQIYNLFTHLHNTSIRKVDLSKSNHGDDVFEIIGKEIGKLLINRIDLHLEQNAITFHVSFMPCFFFSQC